MPHLAIRVHVVYNIIYQVINDFTILILLSLQTQKAIERKFIGNQNNIKMKLNINMHHLGKNSV